MGQHKSPLVSMCNLANIPHSLQRCCHLPVSDACPFSRWNKVHSSLRLRASDSCRLLPAPALLHCCAPRSPQPSGKSRGPGKADDTTALTLNSQTLARSPLGRRPPRQELSAELTRVGGLTPTLPRWVGHRMGGHVSQRPPPTAE